MVTGRVFKVIFLLIAVLSSLGAEEVQDRMDAVLKRMNQAFFKRAYSVNLREAHELALKEEFDVTPPPLLSRDMRVLIVRGRMDEAIDKEIRSIEEAMGKLDAAKRSMVLERWRYGFSERLGEAVKAKYSSEPLTRLAVSSSSTYDSNANRLSSIEPVPAQHEGKSDFLQMIQFGLLWQPLINSADFSRRWKWENLFDITRTWQSSYKDNELTVFNVEPRVKLKLGGFLESAGFGLRYQHLFSNFGGTQRSYYNSYRCDFGLHSRTFPLSSSGLRNTRSELSVAY
ncbi:MAG: hypothetical protein HQL31_12210, partial [Planctomycetes bacterium]|nr:hypothetical protein [Planctomycetota bacterium]